MLLADLLKLSQHELELLDTIAISSQSLDSNIADVQSLSLILSQASNLKNLTIVKCSLANVEIMQLQLLLGSIAQLTKLQFLDLSDNALDIANFSDELLQAYAQCFSNLLQLQELKLANNNLIPGNADQAQKFYSFAIALANAPALEILDLNRNWHWYYMTLNDANAASYLVEFLNRIPQLTTIKLYRPAYMKMQISPSYVIELITNNRLQHLNLTKIYINLPEVTAQFGDSDDAYRHLRLANSFMDTLQNSTLLFNNVRAQHNPRIKQQLKNILDMPSELTDLIYSYSKVAPLTLT